jgi:hypothetical protein
MNEVDDDDPTLFERYAAQADAAEAEADAHGRVEVSVDEDEGEEEGVPEQGDDFLDFDFIPALSSLVEAHMTGERPEERMAALRQAMRRAESQLSALVSTSRPDADGAKSEAHEVLRAQDELVRGRKRPWDDEG